MGPVKAPLAAAFLRLFTVQGSWNYERMLGVGMGLAEEPLLRELRRGPDNGAAYRAAVVRGAQFFNAHPYLCGLAVGATARAECEGAPPEQIERLRSTLIGPLGSLGDRLVWAGWLPLLSAAAIAAIALGAGLGAIVGFLLIYNLGHVALRWWALRAGWSAGTGVAVALRHPVLQRSLALVLPAMAFASGFCLPLAASWLARPLPRGPALAFLALAAVGMVLLRWRPGVVTGMRLGLAAVGAVLVSGWVWR
jgi:mannose/fructose/N-acetylgalactosamine-specific phosphotransferase system component IID